MKTIWKKPSWRVPTPEELARDVRALARPKRRAGTGLWVAGGVLAGGAALVSAYTYALRPRLLQWGATDDERVKVLPGDDLLPAPQGSSTRAVTIEAPPERVWPWLLQLGQERGGFYSYEWLENLVGADIHNVDRIVPEFQQIEVGDLVRLASRDRFGDVPLLKVEQVEPARVLVLRAPLAQPGGLLDFTWSFVLEPVGAQATRLLVRSRFRYAEGFQSILANRVLLEPIHFIMERKMLLGVKARAEAAPAPADEPAPAEGAEAAMKDDRPHPRPRKAARVES